MTFRGKLTALAPVAWWRLEESSGTTAADSAGSNPGTYTGTPTLGATGLAPLDSPNLAADFSNNALRYIQVADAAALRPSSLSLVALIDPTSINGNNRIIEKGLGDSGWALKIEGTNLQLQIVGQVTVDYPTSRIGTSRRLVVGTYDAATGVGTLFVDGRPVATATGTVGSAPGPTDPLRIAQKPGGSANSDGWNGKLQHVALFNRALSNDEIADLGDEADLDAEYLWWQGELWAVANRGVASPFVNSFAGSQARIDSSGHLHLKVANTGTGSSLGAEVSSLIQGRGYGTYTVQVGSTITGMHPNVVFGGMFTYGADANYGHREIDACEQSAWSGATGPWTLGHVVWAPSSSSNPAATRGGYDAADITTLTDASQTTVMIWAPDKITFRTYHGLTSTAANLFRESVVTSGQNVTFGIEGGGTYTGPILLPVPSDERVHFNLWVCPNYSGTSDPATVSTTDIELLGFSYSLNTAGGEVVARRGVNSSGGEFADSVLPGTYDTDWHFDSAGSFSFLYSRGHRIIRLPFRWERIQQTLSGALDATNLTRLTDAVNRAGAAGLGVILDVHNYGRYKISGVEHAIGDGTVTQAHFTDLWTRLTAAFKTNAFVIGYGLMNEPHDMPGVTGTFTPAATHYNYESTAQGWVAESGTAVRTTTSPIAGTGSLLGNKTFAAGSDTLRLNDASGLADDISANGATLQLKLKARSANAGSSTQARIEVQNSSFAWQAGPWFPVTVGTGGTYGAVATLQYTPTAGLLANCRAIGIQFEGTGLNGSTDVQIDDVQQGSLAGVLTGSENWEQHSQAALNAIRTEEGAGAHKTVLVPGNEWSAAQVWSTTHPDGWISDSASNFRYEAHHYWDVDHSGDYPDTYATEVTAATAGGWTAGSNPDSLTTRSRAELAVFTNWLTASGALGYIGEVGWPNNADTALWNALGEAWYDDADTAALWVTYWSTSEWWGSYNLSLYSTSGGVLAIPMSPATIVEAHVEGSGGEAVSRGTFGGSITDWLLNTTAGGLLKLSSGTVEFTFWSAKTGGTQYTDLLDENGNATTSISVSGHQIPTFYGPDNVFELWAQPTGGTERYLMTWRSGMASGFSGFAEDSLDPGTFTPAAATGSGTEYASVAALRAATAATGSAKLLGYYSAGDGGGGTFRWDSTDTTSTDNGGTIITPTSGLSSSGRWKRVYEGKLNLRWFGMHPSLTDNTAQLQAAVTWLATDTTRNPGNVTTGGVGFLPEGLYKCQFTAGTSGLSTITVGADNVLIEGEGRGSILTVRSPSAHVVRFFTFTQGVRGQGGGVRDILFEGNSQLEWCIYMTTWRNAAFENVSARDVFSGILDAASTDATNLGENINVDHLDYISSSAVSSCFTQYGVRFRAAAGGTTWTDCSIENSLFVNCWDTGVLLDGCQRFKVNGVRAACNTTSTNTIDGSSRTGILHTVVITNSITNSSTADTGFHVVKDIYMESHAGSETNTANVAVWIDTPSGQTVGLNRLNKVEDVAISTTTGPGIFRVTNTSATTNLTLSNTFIGNRRHINNSLIQIGVGVSDTYLYLIPNSGQLSKVLDQGVRTYINGARNYAWGTSYPVATVGSGNVDVGFITRDTATGRVAWQDRNNTPILIGPRPGVDAVSPYGAQRITSLATPSAPSITLGGAGSTTWTYYVVAIDKNGNKTPPSAAGSVTNGPASLAGSNQNTITWAPVDGAVTYDLLRGATNASVATGLIGCYYQDSAASTSAYTASATNPAGTLTVDGNVTVGALSYRVDPPSEWPALRRGWLAENYPLIFGDNQTALPTAGRLEVARLTLPAAASVTNVLAYAQAGGTSLTAGQCFAVLYSAAGARVGVTADQATAWASSGLKTMALASGPFACAAGDYYVALWFNGTTGPAFIRKSVSSGTNQLNAGFSAPNLLWASADTGLTTTSPSTMGTQTAQGVAYWVGLS